MTEMKGFKMEKLRIGIYNTFEPVYREFINIVIVDFFFKIAHEEIFMRCTFEGLS